MFSAEKELKEWKDVLEHKNCDPIEDPYRKAVTAKLLGNTHTVLQEEKQELFEADTQQTTSVQNYDPVLISIIRRTTPSLLAFDVASVQPMTGPTGLIFAMKARYADNGSQGTLDTNYNLGANNLGTEALFNEADSSFAGQGAHGGDTSSLPVSGSVGSTPATGFDVGRPQSTNDGEKLGTAANPFGQMGFTLERTSVEAKTRGLRAEYTQEMAHDLRKIHNQDADAELANILQTEILSEVNREMIRTINVKAKLGAQTASNPGVFDLDTDSDGRHMVEKFKGLIFQLDVDANKIATETRRGKGNHIICSSNVASAMAATGYLDNTPAVSGGMSVEPNGNLFAGTIMNRIKVFIDPFAGVDYATVIYRGSNPYDAGLFYAPYVPLQMMRATDNDTFQPIIGFKTRYGLKAHPFVQGAVNDDGLGDNRANYYFRIFRVDNIASTLSP